MPARKPPPTAKRKLASPRTPTGAPGPGGRAGPTRPAPQHEVVIVGLGASAGGLAALEEFFRHAPTGLGVAYVVVQHLDPEHASVLAELLQRVTSMPVVEVTDGVTVRRDTVHVIPPNREMEVFQGTLLLTVPSAPRGQRMAVDGFFRSLADERGAEAVGVVLSGTGSDGALGLRAIHQAGGTCLVQAPASARFDGMPAAALAAVPESVVATPADLPAQVARCLAGRGDGPRRRQTPRTGAAEVTRVLAMVRAATGRDFSMYRRTSVVRRIERRMATHQLETVGQYLGFLREHPTEVKALFHELLINVTAFFRDPDAFEALRTGVLPRLLEGKQAGEAVRVWVAGCATGEEAYSLAILLREALEEGHRDLKVQVYATDLDEDAIATARAGVYPPAIEEQVPAERLQRFFVREEAGYRLRKEIRESVVFAVQDLVRDPPFTRLDLVSCRNVFIYMEPALQDRLLTLFHYALAPGGVLFLSPAEGVGERADLFAPVDRRWRLFRAHRSVASARAVLASGLSWVRVSNVGADPAAAPAVNFAEVARRFLLQQFTPAAVLTDRTGTILYVHGDTGPYLRPAPGHATLGVIEMARPGLEIELRAAVQRAAKGKAVFRAGIPVGRPSAGLTVDLTVRPVPSPRATAGLLLVTFQEARLAAAGKAERGGGSAGARSARRIQELTRALTYTRESLQATIEEQQASHEELQSTNEELQSTNEEVQSSNEELETAKEELQSVNEELSTVNAELQAKVEQLSGMQDDMRNLLDAIDIGTIFLDERLRIKRFTREAVRIYRLAAADVGRPLADIKSNLPDQDLLAEAQAVLDTLVPVEREVRGADDAWFLARLLPYRTRDDAIRGVVLTFTDVSKRVAAEASARLERELAERVVATVREPLLVLDGGLRVVFANRAFHEAFETSPAGAVGRHVTELASHRLDLPQLRARLEAVLPGDQGFEGFTLELPAPGDAKATVSVGAQRIQGRSGASPLILLSFRS